MLAAAGERVAALEAYRFLLVASPDDLVLLTRLAVILERLGRHEEGIQIQTRIAALNVARMGLASTHRDEAIAFELALAGFGPTPAEMPGAYTAALFDAYAETFDASLVQDLAYRAPELLLEALIAGLAIRSLGFPSIPGRTTLAMCDVGCGTGLLGALLRPLAQRLDGVDRSHGMLEKAILLDVYDHLAEGDLATTLNSRESSYDVVTAADVFVYMGDLAPSFAAASRSLRPAGLLAFTLQSTGAAGAHLTSSGRYEHGTSYVREAAAAKNLIEISLTAVTLRKEQSRAVEGCVWVFQKGIA
jgi:predicted TPR repeat methyltransferase